MKIVINALQFKQNSSGIGVMIRDLFGSLTKITKCTCEVIVPQDAPEFLCGEMTKVIPIPHEHGQALRRVWFQTVQMGRKYGRDSVLIVTDSKMPFFLPKSCVAVPLITDLAVYRMPGVYLISRVLWWRLQYLYVRRRAKLFLAISEFTKQEIVELFHVPPEMVHVVSCACSDRLERVTDSEKLRLFRNKYQLPERFVLFVGNANPRKNLERVIRAFDQMKRADGLPHHLVIAGEQGWKFDRERTLCDVQNKDEVHFIGFVPDEDMSALYSASELFLFPTLYEGFGIPVLEAQRCGVPVLTSRCSSLPEVGGEGAYYVDPYDVRDIQKGITRLLTDQALTRTLVQHGYQNMRRFSWERSAQQLHEIIERYVKE